MLAHASGVRHAGRGVTRGERWILVLFLNVRRPSHASVPAAGSAPACGRWVYSPDTRRSAGLRWQQSAVCHARRCKSRGVRLSKRRFDPPPLALPGQVPPSLAAAAPTPAQWLASSIDEYRCGLALNPCDAELWFYAAVGLWQLARGRSVADAQLAFRHSLALNPSDARAANNLGVVALERAEAAKAEGAEANTKADGTPSEAAGAADEAAAAAAGSAAVATAALEEALAWFLDAAARDPLGVGADSALNAGVALLRLGRDTDALAHVRRAAQQHPHHERLKSALKILTEGSG